ncbi:MAG: hypothetical protein M3Z04_12420 [Chloroflexota bacterium]|nr:hypothetical protein [Chloroflexota bacterium]
MQHTQKRRSNGCYRFVEFILLLFRDFLRRFTHVLFGRTILLPLLNARFAFVHRVADGLIAAFDGLADASVAQRVQDRARAALDGPDHFAADFLEASEDFLRDGLDLLADLAGCAFDLVQQPVRHEVNHGPGSSGHGCAESGTGVAAFAGFAEGFV